MTLTASQDTHAEAQIADRSIIRLQAATEQPAWAGLFKVGGVAALIAGLIFRRNLAAEWLLSRSLGIIDGGPTAAPHSVLDWFALLQSNRLLALTWLNVFDVVNYALVGIMFLAVCVALSRVNRSAMAMVAALTLMGVTIYLTSNQALTLLALSDQYAAATTGTQRALLLAAGQAVLAIHQHADYEGGIYLSFGLVTVAGLISALVMLRSRPRVFSPRTAYLGVLANGFGLSYYLALVVAPALIALPICISAIFLLAWYVLIGRQLWTMAQTQ